MTRIPSPVLCPYCGTPLPFVVSGQAWPVRNRARRIMARHLNPDALRRCLPLEAPLY